MEARALSRFRSQFSHTFPCSTNHNAPLFSFQPKSLQTNIKLLQPNILRFRPHGVSPATANTAPIDADDEVQSEDDKFDWYSHWYPLAPVSDLDKRVPHAKTVLGIDVVLWWDRSEEKWKVFEDMCPHRLAPLSQGRIDNLGRLQCVYHGWCFDGNGNCKLIPQAPRDGPEIHTSKKACTSVYPCFQQNKIVWFWPNSDPKFKDISLTNKPPTIPGLDDPSFSSVLGIRDISYGYDILIENLLDPSHVQYAHYGIMKLRDNPDKIDREGGKPLDMTVQVLNSSGVQGKNGLNFIRFIAPCIISMFPQSLDERSNPSESILEEDPYGSSQMNKRMICLVFICIPVSPGRSRLIWSFPRNFAIWADRILPPWIFHISQNLVLDSDLYLLHLEEKKISKIGNAQWQKACFVPTKADAFVTSFRKWLSKYSNCEVGWKNISNLDLPTPSSKEQLMERYYSHVVQCRSCNSALKGLKILEVILQVLPIASIGILAAVKQNVLSSAARNAVVLAAVLCFLASRWLSNFIYKTFYFHDYNHALK